MIKSSSVSIDNKAYTRIEYSKRLVELRRVVESKGKAQAVVEGGGEPTPTPPDCNINILIQPPSPARNKK